MADNIVRINQPRDVLLKNMTRLDELVGAALAAPPSLPRLALFTGWSGYGKSFAAAYAAAQHQAFYVEANEFWTRSTMLKALCSAMGLISDRLTSYDMALRIAERLVASGRALIIDEFDVVADRGMVGVVRSLHKATSAPIIMIGEEALPNKLTKVEHFHNLIGFPGQAQPCDLEDARALARLYCKNVEVADGLLTDCITATGGSARRISANLNDVRRVAHGKGMKQIDLETWGDRLWITGDALEVRKQPGLIRAGGRKV